MRCAALLSIVLSSTAALAEERPSADVAHHRPIAGQAVYKEPVTDATYEIRTSTQYEFYGWQNMVIGGASLGALTGYAALASASSSGGGSQGEEIMLVGMGGYLFGSPLIHTLNDRFGKAVGAFGILVGVPASAAVTSYVLSDGCGGQDCRTDAWLIGLGAGLLAAPIIDGLVLGWKTSRRAHSATLSGDF